MNASINLTGFFLREIFRQFDVIFYCLAYECFDLTIYFLLEIFRQFDVIFSCLAYGYFELTEN